MGKWVLLYKDIKKRCESVCVNPPATQQQINDVEETLGNRLPDDIKALLLEMNGDNWFVFSTEQMIETNLSIRKLGCFMPLDCFMFFAGNGCGDLFGYPITSQDGVRGDSVYFWEHEYDNRVWKANDLEDAVKKYYNDEI